MWKEESEWARKSRHKFVLFCFDLSWEFKCERITEEQGGKLEHYSEMKGVEKNSLAFDVKEENVEGK